MIWGWGTMINKILDEMEGYLRNRDPSKERDIVIFQLEKCLKWAEETEKKIKNEIWEDDYLGWRNPRTLEHYSKIIKKVFHGEAQSTSNVSEDSK